MNFYYPQFQSPFGYDNLNDRNKYLHSALYAMLHRHAVAFDGQSSPFHPQFQTVTFTVIDSKDGQPIDPDDVLIDNQSVQFSSVNGVVALDVPADKQFSFTIVKNNYILFEKDDLTASLLDESQQSMTPIIEPEFQTVTFKVVNSKNSSSIDPDDVLINDKHVSFASVNGYVTAIVPASNQFSLTLQKTDYVELKDYFTANQLDKSSQSMTPIQVVVDEEESKVRWIHSVVKDLDTHLLVHDSSGKKLTEVYYNKKTWHDSNISITLDRDDTGNYDGETLTITPLYQDYTYTLVLYDYSNGTNISSMKMSQSDAAFTITYNNQSQTINIPVDVPGVFWNVYQIVDGELSIINTVTETNDFGITARTRSGK